MTLREFAQAIASDPDYRETVTTRARAGTLPPDVELFILEMADGRLSLAVEERVGPAQSRTLALVTPSAWKTDHKEETHD